MPYLIGLTAAATMIAGAWWVRSRRELDLSAALDAPWWLWPLMRLAIYWYWTREVHKDLYSLCGWIDDEGGPSRGPTRYITIRQGNDGRYRVKIKVRRGFPQGDEEEDARMSRKMQVVNHARGTLDLGPVDFKWTFRLMGSHVIITPKRVVPHEAPFADKDVRAAIAAHSGPSKFVVAIGRGDQPIVHDVDQDAPHAVLSASTIGGKSAFLRSVGCQLYRHGVNIVILDIKLGSHIGWACDPKTQQPLPGIHYAGINDDHDALPEIAEALIHIGRLAEHRNAIAKRMLLQGKTPRFERVVVLFDEMNGTMLELKARGLTEAMDAYRKTLWMGRWVCINIIGAGQRLDADAAGGGAARECFGLRILAEYSQQTWNIVAPQADKIQCVPHKYQPGWCAVVYSRDAEEAQRIFFTNDEAKRWALHGDGQGPQRRLPASSGVGQEHCANDQHRDRHRQLVPGDHREHDLAGEDGPNEPADGGGGRHESGPVGHVLPADGLTAGGQRVPQSDARGDVAVAGGVAEGTFTGPAGWGVPRGAQSVGDVLSDGPPASESSDGGGNGHTDMVRRLGIRVNGNDWDAGLDIGGTENYPPTLRGHGASPQPQPTKPLSVHRGGISDRYPSQPYTQQIPGGNGISGNDGGIEYTPLREIAERPWCQYKADTLERYSRSPLKQRLRFPDPAIPRQGRAPARWSERAMEEWCEARKSRESQDGYQPLAYFICPGGRPVLRWGTVIKIGKTVNLTRRLYELSHHPDDVIDKILCDSEDDMDRLEDELHDKYKRQRVYPDREWFRVEGRLAKYLGVSEEVTV